MNITRFFHYNSLISWLTKSLYREQHPLFHQSPLKLLHLVNETSNNLYSKKGKSLYKVIIRYKQSLSKYKADFDNPSYMGLMTAQTTRASVLAEKIIGKENQSLSVWQASPVATYIEQWVLDFFLKKIGWELNASNGIFTSGGTASNELALLIGRNHFILEQFGIDVMNDGFDKLTAHKFHMYASKHSHFSVKRILGVLGFGFSSLIQVEADEDYSMNIEDLERNILDSKENGFIPFCIVATVGTTNFGSIDDVEKIAQIAKKHKLWLHADAAYGGAMILSKDLHYLVNKLHLADSITFDPQKWLYISQSCSMMFLKDASLFKTINFPLDYHYRKSNDESFNVLNLGERTIQVAKRFDALKLWFSLMHLGEDNYNKVLAYTVELADKFYTMLINETGFEVLNKPKLNIVMFRYIPEASVNINEFTEQLFWYLFKNRKLVLSIVELDNKLYFRATIMNPLTKKKDLKKAITYFKKSAQLISNGTL